MKSAPLSLEQCGLADWPKIWAGCWRRLRRWRVPPHWSARDWQEEAQAQGQAAAIQAVQDFDRQARVPLEVFVHWRVVAGVLTRYRREWAYGLRCRPAGGEAVSNGHSSPFSAAQWNETLQAALGRLAEADRWLIDRLFWQGGTQAEIALALGISQQAVSKRKKAIFLSLRNSLMSCDGMVQD
jgi:DNA-directed RNA polymerase specialized sigma24 family protein